MAASSATEASVSPAASAKYDLTHRMAPFMDVHLVLKLMELVEEKGVYDGRALKHARVELLQKTQMADAAVALAEEIGEPVSAELAAKQRSVTALQARYLEKADKLISLIDPEQDLKSSPELEEMLASNTFTLAHLAESHGVTDADVEALFQCAWFFFQSGMHDFAARALYFYRLLVVEDPKRVLRANWGKIVCEILLGEVDEALSDRDLIVEKLAETYASSSSVSSSSAGVALKGGVPAADAAVVALEQRCWLLHASLFIFFQHERCLELIRDTFLAEENLNVIQLRCPWLLRYLVFAVILHKRDPVVLGRVLRVVEQEKDAYTDPILDFFRSLRVDFDLERAQSSLVECEGLLRTDPFLANFAAANLSKIAPHRVAEAAADASTGGGAAGAAGAAAGAEPAASSDSVDGLVGAFRSATQGMVFETYSRIHRRVDIGMMAARLGLSKDDAEKRIVEMVRNARLRARINTKSHEVIMATSHPNYYQQVLDKTKDLTLRTQQLVRDIRGRRGGDGSGGGGGAGGGRSGGASRTFGGGRGSR